MSDARHQGDSSKTVIAAILAVIVVYAITLLAGWPQSGTAAIVVGAGPHEQGEEAPAGDAGDHGAAMAAPPLWTVLPFAILLLGIAVLPLIPATQHWWESNRNRFLVAMVLALIALGYYAFLHKQAIEGHFPSHHVLAPDDGTVQAHFVRAILENAILSEFIPFIVLLFSLYTISGGIRITGDLQAHPMTNAAFLVIGGLLASFIGTTGAAMLLIRPLLETNQ
jgi:hypothetical protein